MGLHTLNFNFSPVPQLLFGSGKFHQLVNLPLFIDSKQILLVTGKASFSHTTQFTWLTQVIEEQNKNFRMVTIEQEPSPDLIDMIVAREKEYVLDLVIGIGGGSVLDAAKAISAMLTQVDSVRNYLEGVGTKVHDGKKIPMIAIPTTAGTGSEATKNAVLSEVGTMGFKRSIRHDHFVPDVAIIDPLLTQDCPIPITAASGLDALTQLMESYISTAANPISDALAISGLGYIHSALLDLCTKDSRNLEKRSAMAYGAYLSGITLANAGLSTVHGFASSIGGLFDIPHGVICGTLLAETTKHSIHALRTDNYLNKYKRLSLLFTGKENLDELVEYLETLVTTLKIPKLGHFGVKVTDAKNIAQLTSNKNNPAALSEDQLIEILINRI